MSRDENRELWLNDGASDRSPAIRAAQHGSTPNARIKRGQELALLAELVDLVRTLSDAQSEQLEVIKLLFGALDALTREEESLDGPTPGLQTAEVSPASTAGDATVSEAGVDGKCATANEQRALRAQARQARHHAEILLGQARSSAQRAADLQTEAANLEKACSELHEHGDSGHTGQH